MRVRLVGSLLAAAVAACLATVQLLAGAPIRFEEPFTLILPFGIPIGAILGARHAPAVVQTPTAHLRVSLAFATQAIVIGALSTSTVAYLASGGGEMIGRTSPLDTVGGVLISAGLGLLFFGVAFFPAITALAYAWAYLVQRAASRS
jgi:hypothetical protein